MPVSRRKYDALLTDYQRVLEQRDEAQRTIRATQSATRTAAGQFTAADDELLRTRLGRLARLVRIVARLRAEVAAADRRAARVQAAYDNAVGLNNPALAHGAQWQTRRSDKPRTEVTS